MTSRTAALPNMTGTRISAVLVLLVAVSCPVRGSPTWSAPVMEPRPPTILKPLLLPAPPARSTLSPELLNLLQNPRPDPSYSSPNNNGPPGTPTANPFTAVYPPSILNQFSNLFDAPSQMPAPRDPGTAEPDKRHSSTAAPTPGRPSLSSSSADPLVGRDRDPYPVESFPVPPTPRTYSPVRAGPATVEPVPPPTATAPFADSTLLPVQPLGLSPDLGEELMKYLSAVGLSPTASPPQELGNNGNTNRIVEPSSDDLQSKTSPLSPSPSTPPPSPTAAKQSPEHRPDQAENPLLGLVLNSQSPINLLNSFLSLPAPNTPTTTTQAPTYIKHSLNPSFVKYLSTLPKL